MAMEPKELTDDWISTLEMEKTAPCIPAGRPILAILLSFTLLIRRSRSLSLKAPSLFTRHQSTRPAEITWEITVARATPATSIFREITKNRFRTTFTTPAAVRKYKGRLVSPTALRTALPKL